VKRLFLLIIGIAITTVTKASDLPLHLLELHPEEGFSIEVPNEPETYLVLMRGDAPHLTDTPVAAILPVPESTIVRLRDSQIYARSFYTIHQFSISNPTDSDGDGIDDLLELRHPLLLDAINPNDALEDADGDLQTNLAEYSAGSNPAEVRQTTVSFATSDRIRIQGTSRIPAARAGTTFPAVVLIHQGFNSRSEWAPYDDAFNDASYVTLAYDIRGHGGSWGSFSSADFDNPNTTPKDLQAALAFLELRNDIDPTRIAIVGASIGGNLACVASQKLWVKTAVNLSGKTSAVRNLAAEPNLDLVSMFHIAAAGDGGGMRAVWANELLGFTTAPRLVEVVANSSAHGVAIFNSDPTLLQRIVDWLGETL
jgi:pimeloyl-ACP methyl ester carboxylesterase